MPVCYTNYVIEKTKTRKKRNDRTHIIYCLDVQGLSYIGITAKTCSTLNKSVLTRFNKHYYRSYSENKNWPLYKAFRKFGIEAFEVSILEVVRGKAVAHKRECELIKSLKPELNIASIVK